jgi:hypothetical protein
MSDGSVRVAKPPKNATPEQLTEWRASQGIPESPDKYDLKLPSGVVLGDGDQTYVDKILANLHGVDATGDIANAAVQTYLQIKEEQAAAVAAADQEHKAEVEDALREEWGSDYRGNKEAILAMLGNAGSTIPEALLNARDPTGRGLMNNADVLRWLAGHARTLGFVPGTIVPAGGDLGESVETELEKIKSTMYLADGQRNPAYWKNEKVQARYDKLLEAAARLKR